MQRSILTRLLVLALGAPAAPLLAQQPAEHPRLVSAESAQCTVCHDELIASRSQVHPPAADDCTTCHEFSVGDEGTTVTLMDSEPDLCVFCHDDKEAAVELALEVPHMPAADSCLTCHDPHASDHRHVLLAPTAEVCAECHDLEDLVAVHGGQTTEKTDCASCHQPHGSDNERMLRASNLHPPFADGSCTGCHRKPFGNRVRLRARGEKLCTACHGEFPEHQGGSTHAALRGERGRAGCLSCHDPHMSDQGAVLVKGGNELCGQCHADLVAAAGADTGHYPAGEDCLNCHQPHTAEQGHLLVEARDELCGTCHDLAPDGDLAPAHLGADPGRLDCLGCHTPHGEGNFKLLARHLHPPVEDGCDTCHEGGHDQLMEGGPPELCLFCHEDPAEGHAFPHGALELGTCTDCHNPHASAQEKLVNAPGAGPCADCHDEQVAADGEVAHGVIDLVGCRACHEPHGGEQEKLLRASGDGLCLSCHLSGSLQVDRESGTLTLLGRFEVAKSLLPNVAVLRLSPDGQRNHPVLGHRVAGAPTQDELNRTEVEFTGELSCLTCHDPHKGRSAEMFRWDAANTLEACRHCHKK